MFEKILIANRGEIAVRIIKTARAMGVKTVAVYSDADKDALFVHMADQAVRIGPPPSAQSYLLIEEICQACQATGAQAVHPGYGFLSENAGFATALAEIGVAFIGPNIKAIEMMGDKIASKKLAEEAGVNTVPGFASVLKDAKEAVKVAEAIGFPVMIKASAGGGGKGMRIARDADEVADGFASAVSEARSSFGDDRVFIEKFIENPRHIEIQVLADSHGQTLHLFERECSIQRRNQKVIEEAPSVFLDEKTRRAMGRQAVALAEAVDYVSAGTVEFIVDAERNFYFLEMNTRLQVEHPVTELITGIDLVAQMIRVAAGERLPFSQKEIKKTGWAVESRIYAEDPYRNFLPSTGRLKRYMPPLAETSGDVTVRIDSGVYEGGEIAVYYDPMIAKLITHAPDRKTAIAAQARALDEFYIDGIAHNIPFLSAIMQHKRWRDGDLSTNFIAEEFPDGFAAHKPKGRTRELLIVVAAICDHISRLRRRQIDQQMAGAPLQLCERRVVALDGEMERVKIHGELGDLIEVSLHKKNGKPGKVFTVETDWWPGQPIWRGKLNNIDETVKLRRLENGLKLAAMGSQATAHVLSEREAELMQFMPVKVPPDTSKLLQCPMPGVVMALHVQTGEKVVPGQPLATVEAMKMENILRAERDAMVAEIHAAEGDVLAVDAIILTFS